MNTSDLPRSEESPESDPPLHHIPATPNEAHIRPPRILRRLAGHWWQIVLLWLAVTAPILLAIEWSIKPTYQAMSVLQIEPLKPELYGYQSGGFADYRTVSPYLSTQATLFTSDRVLNEAVADPFVRDLAWITKSENATTDLRNQMLVDVGPDNFLIHVMLELPDAKEAATIVNAVVSAYVKYNTGYEHSRNSQLKKNLKLELERLAKEIKEKKADLSGLYAKGTVEAPTLNHGSPNNEFDPMQPAFSEITEAENHRLADSLIQCDLEYLEAVAQLEAANMFREQARDETEAKLERRIGEDFQNDPKVADVIAQIDEAQSQLELEEEETLLFGGDPSMLTGHKRNRKLSDHYVRLWQQRYEGIRQRLIDEDQGMFSHAKIREREAAVEKARRKKIAYLQYIVKMRVKSKEQHNDTFEASFLTADVNSLMKKQEAVTTKLQQLDFEDMQETYRVIQIDPAVAPLIPVNYNKLKYMAVAPIAVFFLILSLFLVHEIKAGWAARSARLAPSLL
jgi:hypothetical protein